MYVNDQKGGGHSPVLLCWMKQRLPQLYGNHICKDNKNSKPLSQLQITGKSDWIYQKSLFGTKALSCVRLKGSFTIEAALVLPIFLFASVVLLGLFQVLLLQVQVNNGLQYAARLSAVACQDSQSEGDFWGWTESEILFRRFMNEQGYEKSVLEHGLNSISFLYSDCSGDEIFLCASYKAKLPITFGSLKYLPVEQSVRVKKWTGANSEKSGEKQEFVYITPSGSAYHATTECPYLKLSISGVLAPAVQQMRNKDGHIYYPCRCYAGGGFVYITDYGTDYHSDLNCSGLKRTIYRVDQNMIGNRHACGKCY